MDKAATAAYVGATTCQSSMCHGGAGPMRKQFTVWSRDDFHSRSYATLTTARSARMSETLGLTGGATASTRCTTCHAPLAGIASGHIASTANAMEGVSCEQCHGAAGNWLRSHVRPEMKRPAKVAAGLRDMRDAYARATTCVACHQQLDADILAAGHPELIFELDGQGASEPRHWTEKESWFGPKAWLVGQAVVLREMSKGSTTLTQEQAALLWLLRQLAVAKVPAELNPGDLEAWSDNLARTLSKTSWTEELTRDCLRSLTETPDFTDPKIAVKDQSLRAERLVMGLDRLSKSLAGKGPGPGAMDIKLLFAQVQDRKTFQPAEFAKGLNHLAVALNGAK